MSGFADKFLREGKKLVSPGAGPFVHLCAFGKHPGWDDHMEELGLDTESLLLARQVLYVDGLGGQINSGDWEKLAEAQRLPAFKHLFVWKRGESFLLGRMWSSTDGKGRSRYPMIACAHCHGISLAAALHGVLPALERFERDCKATKSAEAVRQILARAQKEVTGLPSVNGNLSMDGRGRAFVEKLCPPGGEEKFLRILYQLHAQCPPDAFKSDAGAEWDEHAVRIRLPALADYPTESLLYWSQFLGAQLRAPIPILTLLPLAEPWLDALIGKPKANDFFPLLARPDAFAVVSDVAYEIDNRFRAESVASVKKMRDGTSWLAEKSPEPVEKRSWNPAAIAVELTLGEAHSPR